MISRAARWLPLAVLCVPALAAGADADIDIGISTALDDLVDIFRQSAGEWEEDLRALGLRVFGVLAVIQMTWTGIQIMLSNPTAERAIVDFTREVLVLAFFYLLLFQSVAFSNAIVGFFTSSAIPAVGGSEDAALRPSAVLAQGLGYATGLIREVGMHPGTWAMLFAAFVVGVAFALVTATMVIVLIEAYALITLGVVFMALGGLSFTRNAAVAFFTFALGVGAKIFVLHAIIALGMGAMETLAGQAEPGFAWALVVMAGAVVILALCASLPDTVAGMVGGARTGSAQSLMSAVTSTSVAAQNLMRGSQGVRGGVLAARGASMALRGAHQAAVEDADPPPVAGSGFRAAAAYKAGIAGRTIGNLMQAGGAVRQEKIEKTTSGGRRAAAFGAMRAAEAAAAAAERNRDLSGAAGGVEPSDDAAGGKG